MKNSTIKIYAAGSIMSFIAVFGVVMYLPMLSHLQSYFGVSVSQISWLPNLGYFTMIVFAALVGKLAKKIETKNLLLVTLLLWLAGLVIELTALNSVTFWLFVIGRFIEGAGEAFIFPILISLNKAELKEGKEQKVGSGLIEFASSLGGLLSAMISGKFLNNPKQFLVLPITIAVFTIIYIATQIHRIPLAQEKISEEDTSEKESLKPYISLLLMIFVIQIVFSSIQVYLTYYMESFKSAASAGGIISLEQVAIGIGTLAPIFMTSRMPFKIIRNLIFCAFTFGIIILALQISIYPSAAAAFVVALFVGIGFTVMNIYISKVIKRNFHQKLSIYASIRNSGGFVLSFIWGRLIQMYRNSGESYGMIFKQLYFFEAITVVAVFLILIMLQKKEVSFGNPKDFR